MNLVASIFGGLFTLKGDQNSGEEGLSDGTTPICLSYRGDLYDSLEIV